MCIFKKLSLLLVLVSYLPACSQSVKEEQAEAFFISLIVEDVDISKKWYAVIFDFQTTSENKSEEGGFRIINMERPGMNLELIQLKNSTSIKDLREAIPEIKRVEGIFKFGITVNRFDEWLKHLEKEGVSRPELVVKIPGSEKRMLVISDPDGNRVQIFEN